MIGRDRRGTPDEPLTGRVIGADESLPGGARPRIVGVFARTVRPESHGPGPAAAPAAVPPPRASALPPPVAAQPAADPAAGEGAHEGAHPGGQQTPRTRRLRDGWARGGPDAPAGAEHLPPWRRAAAPPPPPPGGLVPAAVPGGGVPVQVVHHVHHVITDSGPDVPPRWSWDWLAAALRRWARPRQLLVAIPLTIPLATVWSDLMQICRAEAGIPAAYIVAAVPLAYFALADSRSHRLSARVGFFVSVIGLGAVTSPWDFVLIMTGVGL